MPNLKKKDLILDGLCCANCAAKIEDKVGKINGVTQSSVNFIYKTLTVETDKNVCVDDVMPEIKSIVNKIEPDVIVKEKILQNTEKKVLILDGLCCANCTEKIETKVKNISGVKSASVDFVSKKLFLEVTNKDELPGIIGDVKVIIKNFEPDVKVIIEDKNKKQIDSSSDEGENNKKIPVKLIISAVIFGTAMIFKFSNTIEFTLFFISYVLVGEKCY